MQRIPRCSMAAPACLNGARERVMGLDELNALSALSNDNDPIVLVDAYDVPQGIAPKIDVHRRGLRHRALSVLVRDSAGNMLVHRRNAAKYHSGGLWTNACGSPRKWACAAR
jgi:hypothetical protein